MATEISTRSLYGQHKRVADRPASAMAGTCAIRLDLDLEVAESTPAFMRRSCDERCGEAVQGLLTPSRAAQL